MTECATINEKNFLVIDAVAATSTYEMCADRSTVMIDTDTARSRRLGLSTSLIGVAHFVVPRVFDPINRLGFPNHARTFTYVNGALETMIGVFMAGPRTRRLSKVVSGCYVTYLTSAVLLTQVRTRRGHVVAR